MDKPRTIRYMGVRASNGFYPLKKAEDSAYVEGENIMFNGVEMKVEIADVFIVPFDDSKDISINGWMYRRAHESASVDEEGLLLTVTCPYCGEISYHRTPRPGNFDCKQCESSYRSKQMSFAMSNMIMLSV